MALKHHIHILLLLSIFFTSQLELFAVGATSNINSQQDSYEEWLKWNVQNHHNFRRRVALEHQQSKRKVVVAGNDALDVRVVNAENNKIRLVVNQDGSGDYKTITEALNTIPPRNTKRIILHIKPGVYREKINIPKTKPFITFAGELSNPPIITGNDTASVARGDGTTLKTFQSATVGVDADYFVALGIIFENTAPHEVGTMGEQAVALRISGNKAAFYECSFYGSQDTLYDHKGLHYFHNCFIQGSVDFIFGYGRSFYENCTLNSIAKKVASVTAQKRTQSSLSSGFSFKNCTLTGSGRVYLGRAWGDFSTVVFSYSFFDKLVLPQAWSNWGNPNRNPTVYYGEYKCSGPGSNMTGRVPWARALTDQEAEPFIGTYFVEADTWLISPST